MLSEEAERLAASKSLLFVVTEDWFFRSHFLPMADAAKEAGFRVFVACRCGDARSDLEARGLTVLPLDGRRSDTGLASLWSETMAISRIIRDHDINIAHFIALRPILVGFALATFPRRHRSVFALTGRGYLGGDKSLSSRTLRALLRLATPRLWAGNRSWFLFENRDDPAFLGLDPDRNPNLSILGGAGVDPGLWRPDPLPEGPTLRIAFVGRMLRIKGVADAVEALSLARREGADVELSLYGEPDPANPASLSRAELEGWARLPGVSWRGRTDRVAEVWAAHHACVQPSLGGEGLPRVVLEAAACGRAILATDTPGCRDFVREGREGLLVPPGRPDLLAKAILRLAADREEVAGLAAGARRRLFEGFTADDVSASVRQAYERLWNNERVS